VTVLLSGTWPRRRGLQTVRAHRATSPYPGRRSVSAFADSSRAHAWSAHPFRRRDRLRPRRHVPSRAGQAPVTLQAACSSCFRRHGAQRDDHWCRQGVGFSRPTWSKNQSRSRPRRRPTKPLTKAADLRLPTVNIPASSASGLVEFLDRVDHAGFVRRTAFSRSSRAPEEARSHRTYYFCG